MHVLLIAQAYPPFPAVGALRARNLARAFARAGHRVTVLTERLPGETGDRRAEDDGVRVRTVAVGPRYATRLLQRARRLRGAPSAAAARAVVGAAPAATAAPAAAPAPAAPRGALRRLALALFAVPDPDQHLVRPLYHAARALVRAEGVDVAYTSAPPFSTHLVGLLLQRRDGVRWVAEFRDPWLEQRGRADIVRSAPVEALHRRLERHCLRTADQVVCVTHTVRDRLAAKVPAARRDRFLVALNGIGALAPATPTPHEGPVGIAYVGSFYHDRDPVPLLDALARVIRDRALTPDDVVLDLVGNCRRHNDADVEALVAARGLAPFVRFRDWVEHAEAQRLTREADLLVLFAVNQPLQVPNKLYDYLGARRPILAWVDDDGESARMLREVGGHHVIPGHGTADDFARAIGATLDRAREGHAAEPVGRAEVLEGWLAERQLDALVRALDA